MNAALLLPAHWTASLRPAHWTADLRSAGGPEAHDPAGRPEAGAPVRPSGVTAPLVVFTGGGTGGHVYPGLAVASELRELHPALRVLWIGTRDRLEATLVPKAGIPIEFIQVAFLKGRGVVGKLRAAAILPRALWQSWRLLGRHKPALVVGVGGFASGPVGVAAFLRRIPLALLEQNATPGFTNRVLSRIAKRVFVTFVESKKWFDERKVRVTGNPIRRELIQPAPAAEQTGPGPRLLVFGGSQGATVLNRHLPAVLRTLHEQGIPLSVRHAAGRGRLDEARQSYGEAPFVELTEYIDDMAAAYRWADFVVCRAGAGTVAEVTAAGKPALYVPFPAAADNHQEKNALAVVAAGGGLMARDAELAATPPVAELQALLSSPERLAEMGRRAAATGRPEAARDIARELTALLEAA